MKYEYNDVYKICWFYQGGHGIVRGVSVYVSATKGRELRISSLEREASVSWETKSLWRQSIYIPSE